MIVGAGTRLIIEGCIVINCRRVITDLDDSHLIPRLTLNAYGGHGEEIPSLRAEGHSLIPKRGVCDSVEFIGDEKVGLIKVIHITVGNLSYVLFNQPCCGHLYHRNITTCRFILGPRKASAFRTAEFTFTWIRCFLTFCRQCPGHIPPRRPSVPRRRRHDVGMPIKGPGQVSRLTLHALSEHKRVLEQECHVQTGIRHILPHTTKESTGRSSETCLRRERINAIG